MPIRTPNECIYKANWQKIWKHGDTYVTMRGRYSSMISLTDGGRKITDIITISNVSVEDNGTQYRCSPYERPPFTSNSGLLIIAGDLKNLYPAAVHVPEYKHKLLHNNVCS